MKVPIPLFALLLGILAVEIVFDALALRSPPELALRESTEPRYSIERRAVGNHVHEACVEICEASRMGSSFEVELVGAELRPAAVHCFCGWVLP